MPLIDLSLPMPDAEKDRPTSVRSEKKISGGGLSYTGVIYQFSFGSMAGTYIDLPGHIQETDDGVDCASYPVENLYRLDATVIRLNRQSGSGKISADELRTACPYGVKGGALIINALGAQRFGEIVHRSVYLGKDAVAWIISTGIHLFASDVYESDSDPQGVFLDLFKNGICTVCCPVNLHQLPLHGIKLSVFPLAFPSVTQFPCRMIAEADA